MLKKLIIFLVFFVFTCVAYYVYHYYANNKNESWPESEEIQATFEQSIEWLKVNYSTIKNKHNPALWWMLKEASEINDNKTLNEIYQKYKSAYVDTKPPNIWTPYFRTYYRPEINSISELDRYVPYQIFFAYALSCSENLKNEPVIQQQLDENYCSLHYLRPRCVTHQLIAVRMMQQRYCGDDAKLNILSKALQEIIVDELTYDFRVTDSYIQRVLTLAEAGNVGAIKPVWLRRIIDAQNSDGGWGNMYPIVAISDTKSIGWTSTRPAYASSQSTFHATAQGVWLMALLLKED